MSLQINPVSLEKTEPVTMIKNEPLESEIAEIGMDRIINEEITMDIKNIDVSHNILCEDPIKSETVPDHIFETVFIKTENAPFMKTKNITESENLNKTENPSNDNSEEGVEVQGSKEHFNTLGNLETNKQVLLDFSKKTDFAECHKTIKAPAIPVEPHEYTTIAKDKHVCNHCHSACKLLNNLKRHIKQKHRKITTMHQCPYCSHISKWSIREHIIRKHKDTSDIQWFQCHLCEKKFKLKYHLTKHMETHLMHEDSKIIEFCPVCGKGFQRLSSAKRHMKYVHNKEERNKEKRKCRECEYTTTERQLLDHHIKNTHKNIEKRYLCDKCNYKTIRRQHLDTHKLIHLKPEEIQYFYCYHCSYKSNRKENLKKHVFKHFENGDVLFHCYICNSMMPRREKILEHIKTHSKDQIKSEIIEVI